jgi:dTDP-4-dehydrorhamnose reductase
MAKRWLVTGGTGQVGVALRRLQPKGIEIVAPARNYLDLSNLPDDITPLLDGVTALINCGAYTSVDKAESEQELAHSINAIAPARLAKAAELAGIPIIHVSTDYVFPVDSKGPWREDSATGPGSIYGRTKLEGEEAVRTSGARFAIVRTAWVVSAHGNNFVKTMLRVGAQSEVVRVVADQLGSPTHAGDLAASLAAITDRFTADASQSSGTWHCSNGGETTWHGLATYVFQCARALGLKVPSEVQAITTASYPTPARRPLDSRLDCTSLKDSFRLELRPWRQAIEEIVETLALGMEVR